MPIVAFQLSVWQHSPMRPIKDTPVEPETRTPDQGPNDPVEAVITAYLDHLEHGAPKPSLHHLGDDDRQRALEFIDLMRSRPSLDALLAGTEFEGWLDAPDTHE